MNALHVKPNCILGHVLEDTDVAPVNVAFPVDTCEVVEKGVLALGLVLAVAAWESACLSSGWVDVWRFQLYRLLNINRL